MKKALIICLIFFVLQQLFATAAMVFTMAWTGSKDMAAVQTTPQFAWAFAVAYLLLYPLVVFIVNFLMSNNGQNFLHGAWQRPRPLAVALSIATLIAIVFWLGPFVERMDLPDLIESQLGAMLKNPVCILLLCVLGPVVEEICFRRGVMEALYASERWRHSAIFISALLFGLIHMNPPQMIAGFILGLFLGWLYERTRSLWLPVVCHVANNTFSVISSMAFGQDANSADLFPTTTALAVGIGVAMILTFYFWRRLARVI